MIVSFNLDWPRLPRTLWGISTCVSDLHHVVEGTLIQQNIIDGQFQQRNYKKIQIFHRIQDGKTIKNTHNILFHYYLRQSPST